MNQSNKRNYAPPRSAAPRRSAPGQNSPHAPGGQPQLRPVPGRQSAPMPRRRIGRANSEVIRMLAIGAVVVVLAYGLQCIWPNGFPLQVNTQSTVAVQSQVNEIYSKGPLRINEIMTSNRNTISLADGSSPDWIEVQNISSSAINLAGYTLSKSADASHAFTFPAMTLESGACVLVYADGRLREDAQAQLHAPFNLSSSGDTLLLFNAGGTAIDTVNIIALGSDQSYARMDEHTWQRCNTPTPALANTQENYAALQQPSGDSPVVITEIMSSNKSAFADANGRYYDYIELYNRSGEAVDLTGWHLSDDAHNVGKWSFPARSLGAGEYMLVFASKLDCEDEENQLHTNFALSSEGEQLILSNGESRIMDRVDFGMIKADTSLSLTGDGSWSSDLTPTPGRANQ